MKILYVTTTGGTMNFFRSLILAMIERGDKIDIACNKGDSSAVPYYTNLGCKIYQVDFSRAPLSRNNIKAIKQLKMLIKNGEYHVVHCHTPVAAACTRFACKTFRKGGLKVFYTAHGFHFYKGAPFKNWLLYYPIEKICSRWTDELITINKEDYELAKKKMKAERIEYIPGVGINVEKFRNALVDRNKKRQEIDVPNDAFLILSVGELNENKNHQIVLRAMSNLNDKTIHYAIAGEGNLKEKLKELSADLKLNEQFHLLGHRNDVAELYKAADVYALPSIREGLNVSVMEALAAGLPCVVSKIRGNVDMVQDGTNGYFIDPFNVDSVVESLKKARTNRIEEGITNTADRFNFEIINDILLDIYKRTIE